MKRFITYAALLMIATKGYCGIISHSDYVSNAPITAAGQNANENRVYNEFNGNIQDVNVAAAAGIKLSKLAALTTGQVLVTDASGVIVTTASPTQTEVGYTAGVTGPIQTQFNAISSNTFVGIGRNRILNGDMLFDQNLEGGVTGNGYTTGNNGGTYGQGKGAAIYTLDNMRVEATKSSTFTVTQVSNITAPGFLYSMKLTITSSATIDSQAGANFEIPLDPTMMRDWQWGTTKASTVTLSFYIDSSITGSFPIAFLNGVDSRSYVSSFTVTQAGVWQRISVTVPGDQTGGTSVWPSTGNVFGLKIVLDMGSGSAVQTSTLNQWQAGTYWSATGANQLVTSGNGTQYFDGMQIEVGTTATAFEFLPASEELRQLQRFYWKTIPQFTAAINNAGPNGSLCYIATSAGVHTQGMSVRYPTESYFGSFPATPTALDTSASNAGLWYNITQNAISGTATFANIGPNGFFVKNPQVAGDTVGDTICVHLVVDSRLGGN